MLNISVVVDILRKVGAGGAKSPARFTEAPRAAIILYILEEAGI